MTSLRNDQRGLGLWEIILLILILLILALVGWRVWEAKQESDKSSKNAESASNSQAASKESGQKQEENKDEVSYLEVPQLKVKVKLNASVTGLQYVMQNDSAYFTLKSFLDEANNSGKAMVTNGQNQCEQLAAMSLITKEEFEDDIQNTKEYQLSDGRYVSVAGSQASCLQGDTAEWSTSEATARTAILKVIEDKNNVLPL